MVVRLYGHGTTLCKSMAVRLYIMQIHGCTAGGMDLYYITQWMRAERIHLRYGSVVFGMHPGVV